MARRLIGCELGGAVGQMNNYSGPREPGFLQSENEESGIILVLG